MATSSVRICLRFFPIVGILWLFVIAVHSQENQKPRIDLSGTWILDIENSDRVPQFLGGAMDLPSLPMDGPIMSMGGPQTVLMNSCEALSPLVIKQTETEIQFITPVNTGDKTETMVEKFALDGKEIVQEIKLTNVSGQRKKKTMPS